ncbi:hypothetical protein ACQY1Q_10435 [Tenacibaculum sp. TC6]|uniref:hypothetical protein n=1 Tax=Tenacibaculum sp. TC6 TaxID=3423223 RepID=UPI003D365E78
MENYPKNSDLIYIPNLESGDSLFDGIPCPTHDALKYLGEEGIQYIHQRLNEMLNWRKTMYGEGEKEHFGFYPVQHFISIKHNIKFRVGEAIQDYMEVRDFHINNKFSSNPPIVPELVVSDILKRNNYENLIKKNHYIIDTNYHMDRIPENITIPEYYRFKYS